MLTLEQSLDIIDSKFTCYSEPEYEYGSANPYSGIRLGTPKVYEPISRELDIFVSIIVGLSYNNLLFFSDINSFQDLSIELSKSHDGVVNSFFKLWTSRICDILRSKIDSPKPYIDCIQKLNLNKFKSDDSDIILKNWAIQHTIEYLRAEQANRFHLYDDHIEDSIIEVLNLPYFKQDSYNNRTLFSSNSENIIEYWLEHDNSNYVIYIDNHYEILKAISLLFGLNCQLVKRDNNDKTVFCFDEAESTFDNIICTYSDVDDIFTQIDFYSKDGGVSAFLYANNDKEHLTAPFFTNKIELYALFNGCMKSYVISRKCDSNDNNVPTILVNEDYGNQDVTIDMISEFLKTRHSDHFYCQLLQKEDFNYYQGKRFSYELFRKKELKDFIWIRKDELLTKIQPTECIHDDEFRHPRIKTSLIDNLVPFNFAIQESLGINRPQNGYQGENDEVKTYIIEDSSGKLYLNDNPELPHHKYLKEYYDFNLSEEAGRFIDKLTLRYITRPVWCYSKSSNKYAHIIASRNNPVLIQYLNIAIDNNNLGYEGLDLFVDVIPYEINPLYDEECMAYLLSLESNKNIDSILVPPTKMSQHAYFLQKRDEFLKKHTAESYAISARDIDEKRLIRINSISFENFRRYKEETKISFGNITFFVGGNNCGKSTIVKGLLLVLSNAKNKLLINDEFHSLIFNPKFRFDADNFFDVKIKTFERAHCRRSKDLNISFTVSIGIFDIYMKTSTSEANKEMSVADIDELRIKDNRESLVFSFNFKSNKSIFWVENKMYESDCSFCLSSDSTIITACIRGIAANFFSSNANDHVSLEKKKWVGLIHSSADSFELMIDNACVEYIYSHSASQDVLYSTLDQKNYIADTIHNYFNLSFENSSIETKFIKHWMNEFNIGTDFTIIPFGGEVYLVKIKDSDGVVGELADYGMGGIQIFTMLLRMAIIIGKYKNRIVKPVVIIEEPEQNLHPAFQSKLTDLFFELQKEYGLSFIVETHSEYIIRRSQVLAKNNFDKSYENDKNNWCVFKTYYFPSAGQPYDMGYQPNGKFVKKFDSGFYDIADDLIIELI